MKIEVDICGYGFAWTMWHYEFTRHTRILLGLAIWWKRSIWRGWSLATTNGLSWQDGIAYCEMVDGKATEYTTGVPFNKREFEIHYSG
jgi:hypothetical protein